ncbi:MAG: hypothetical protein IJJ83_04535 [Muribaculaceae bacterium]|nr:hypothetical protein [Muribaculaceae bacterium]
MKKFTKIAAIAMLMVAGMPGAAQNNVGILNVPGSNAKVTMTGRNNSKFVLNEEGNKLTQVLNQTPRLNDGGEMVTLNCNLVPINDNMYSGGVFAFSTTDDSYYSIWGSRELPVGTYDLMASFYGNGSNYYIIKENVTLSSDITVTFDASEAHLINDIHAYNPDGELFTLDEYIYDENWNLIDFIQGNADFGVAAAVLVRKSDLSNFFSGMSSNTTTNVYVNSLSDRFAFIENRIYVTNIEAPCMYLLKFYVNGDNKLLENNPNNYVYHEEEFMPSKVGESSGKGVGISLVNAYNGFWIGGVGLEHEYGNVVKFLVDEPDEMQSITDHIDMLVHPIMIDNVFEGNTSQQIVAPSMQIEDGVKMYNVYGPSISMNDYISFFYMNDFIGSHWKPICPGNATFSFTNNEKIGNFGGNTPINMLAQLEENFDDMSSTSFECCYMGRFGEKRSVDAANCDVTLIANGEQITSVNTWDGPVDLNYSNMNNYFSAWDNPDRVKGITEITFDNQNIIVDGMQGRNLTTVVFDETKEDHCAPTMTMLQMRDGNNCITDHFETAQDGKVTFSCGDFKQQDFMQQGINNHWFDCELPNVEVSFAPYGQNEWQRLNITEDANAFSMPYFGHVFNAEISSINSDGWYDLKFKLTDHAGNWQEQIVSPAFLIGNNTPACVDEVTGSEATEVARYTIDGRAISAPQAGVNIVKMSDGTVKKVLVK